MQQDEQFTYLMRDGKYYKIGKSNNPKKRLSTFKVGNPGIRLITYGKGVSEDYLHREYKKFRVSGEWFKLDNRSVAKCIADIKDGSVLYSKPTENWEKLANSKIKFGKYKDTAMRDMTSQEQISYLLWYVTKAKKTNKKTVKVFKWWLKELGEL